MNSTSMTVRAKLASAFTLLALLIALVAGLAIKSLNDANDRFSLYVKGTNASLLLSYEVRTAVERRAIAARDLVNATTPQDREVIKAEVRQAHGEVQDRMLDAAYILIDWRPISRTIIQHRLILIRATITRVIPR